MRTTVYVHGTDPQSWKVETYSGFISLDFDGDLSVFVRDENLEEAEKGLARMLDKVRLLRNVSAFGEAPEGEVVLATVEEVEAVSSLAFDHLVQEPNS